MTRGIIFYPEKCKDDCSACLEACEKKYGISLLTLTPSKIIVSCHHCESPACARVCKTEAISKIKGIVKVNPELCVGCLFCFSACPYGAIYPYNSKVMKCEICEGEEEPLCIKACKEKALALVNVPQETLRKIKLSAQRPLNFGEDLLCFVNLIEE